jgi:hypothetical protein
MFGVVVYMPTDSVFCSTTFKKNARCICAVNSYRHEQITLKLRVLHFTQLYISQSVVWPVTDNIKIRNLYEVNKSDFTYCCVYWMK